MNAAIKPDEAAAWLDGRLAALDAAVIPVTDAGFVLGTTVSEQLRTFAGRLFRLDEHLERLIRSLEIVEIEPPFTPAELAAAATQLAARNHALLRPGSDLGLSIFATPGPYPTFAGAAGRPTVGMHTYELPFGRWAKSYDEGVALVTTGVVPPAESWPPQLKCRSRMHYYLADRQAARVDAGARALLTNGRGEVLETSTANVLAVVAGRLVSPPRAEILRGITRGVVIELGRKAGLHIEERPLSVAEIHGAQEVLLTSTPFAILPVTKIDRRAIGGGRPGETFRDLMARFSAMVGLDIAAQARV